MLQLEIPDIIGYLERRGRIPVGPGSVVTACSGGVSGHTFLVDSGGARVVVKQALERLRTDAPWISDPRRALVEARGLEVFGVVVGPDSSPRVLDVDDERCVVTMTGAPAESRSWKELLLNGQVEPAVARALGAMLGRWHGASGAAYREEFGSLTWFRELRVEPFHLAVAGALPRLATRIQALVDDLGRARTALVHGDFSPKNILVFGDGRSWVIDFEVCHWGDPTFDLAFMLHHLIMKAIHRPGSGADLFQCARSFLEAYLETRSGAGESMPSESRTLDHVGCLLLARVVGTSPATYLTVDQARQVRDLGEAILQGGPTTLVDVWPGGTMRGR